LREIETGKTCGGIEQIGEKERPRESRLGRERDIDSGERKQRESFEKMAWVDLNAGLNQYLGICLTNTCVFLETSINRTIV